MKPAFNGFPKDIHTFLRELSNNNNREWFNDNKERYRASVVEPMVDFIYAMGPRLEKVSEYFVADPRPHGGSMFRIYRDTRFSKDKRPYKEHVACQFRHSAGRDAHAPGFYVHLEPGKVMFGGGIWLPPNPVLDKIRRAIADKPDEWKKATGKKSFRDRFGGILGDQLKRPPRGYDKDHPLMEDLKRKSLFVMQTVKPSAVQDKGFVREVELAFRAASPMMGFISRALELPY